MIDKIKELTTSLRRRAAFLEVYIEDPNWEGIVIADNVTQIEKEVQEFLDWYFEDKYREVENDENTNNI
jgi:hypothetical protein